MPDERLWRAPVVNGVKMAMIQAKALGDVSGDVPNAPALHRCVWRLVRAAFDAATRVAYR